jgi:hypothetical protein
MVRKQYRLKEAPKVGGQPEVPAGTVVYEWTGHDYGAASFDSMMLREPFISVSLVPGENPYFTVPVRVLEEIHE